MRENDAQIQELLRNDDPRALDLIYDAYGALLYGFLSCLICVKQDTEDCFQNLFILTEDDVEHQLSHCTTVQPSEELRSTTLSAAKAAWKRPKSMLTFKRWAMAAAAVFAFTVGGAWYDSHQNSLQENGKTHVVSAPRAYDTELIAELDLDEDARYLVGLRRPTVAHIKGQSTTWLEFRRQITKQQ